jgi:acyl dehydratase
MTYFFEDFPVGETSEYGAYQVTREAIVAFARQFDPQPFHLDEEAARASLLGGLAASGWHTAAILMRMNCDAFLSQSVSMGGAEIEELRWLKPVRPGHILTVRRHTLAARVSQSRPEIGLLTMMCEVRNQAGETVMTQKMIILMGRRGHRWPPRASPALRKPSATLPITPANTAPNPPRPSLVEPFDEIVVGTYRDLGQHPFSAAEIIDFAKTYDPQPFHLSEATAANSPFGGLIASGWHTAAVFMRRLLATRKHDAARQIALGKKVIEAGPSPGFQHLKWLKPVYAGDTLTFATQAVGKRPTSRQGWGVVTSQNMATNQNDAPVLTFSSAVFWPRE